MWHQDLAPPVSVTAVVGRGAPRTPTKPSESSGKVDALAIPQRRPKATFPNPRKEKGENVVNSPKGKLDVLRAALEHRLHDLDARQISDPRLPHEASGTVAREDWRIDIARSSAESSHHHDEGFDALNDAIAAAASRLGAHRSLRDRFAAIARHIDGFFSEQESAEAAARAVECIAAGVESPDVHDGSATAKKAFWSDKILGSELAAGSAKITDNVGFRDPRDATHDQLSALCLLLGAQYLRSASEGAGYLQLLRTILRQVYKLPFEERLPHVVMQVFQPVSDELQRRAQMHDLREYLASLPLWRDLGSIGISEAERAADEKLRAGEQADHEKAAFESVVAHWKRYSLARVFKGWRGAVLELRAERNNVGSRFYLEQQIATLQKSLDERATQVRQLMERVTELQNASQRERQAWARQTELDRGAMTGVRLRVKELQDQVQKLENDKMTLEARTIFLQSELDRRLTRTASSVATGAQHGAADQASHSTSQRNVVMIAKSAVPAGLEVTSMQATIETEARQHLEAAVDLLDEVCRCIAPDRIGFTAGGGNAWVNVFERAIEDSHLSVIDLCHIEKISQLSYNKAEFLQHRANEIPFPAEKDLPDALELLLAGNVLFSPIPLRPTMIIERPEAPKIAALREKVRDMFTRARSMESLRTRLNFEVAAMYWKQAGGD